MYWIWGTDTTQNRAGGDAGGTELPKGGKVGEMNCAGGDAGGTDRRGWGKLVR